MEVNPNLSEKAQYDYALVLRATEKKDQKAYAELMTATKVPFFIWSIGWCSAKTMRKT